MNAVKIEDGKMVINLIDLLEYMDNETTETFLHLAAFREALAKFVMGHILGTGVDVGDDNWDIGDLGTKLRFQLMPMMDEVSKIAIRELIKMNRSKDREIGRQRKYSRLMYGYADGIRNNIRHYNGDSEIPIEVQQILNERKPEQPPRDYDFSDVTDEEVDEVLAGIKRVTS